MGNRQTDRLQQENLECDYTKIEFNWKSVDQEFLDNLRQNQPSYYTRFKYKTQKNIDSNQGNESHFNMQNCYFAQLIINKNIANHKNAQYLISKRYQLQIYDGKQQNNQKISKQTQSVSNYNYVKNKNDVLIKQINKQNSKSDVQLYRITKKQLQIYYQRIKTSIQNIKSQFYHQQALKKIPIVDIYQMTITRPNFIMQKLSSLSLCQSSNSPTIIIHQQYIPLKIYHIRNLTHFQGLYVVQQCFKGFMYLYKKFGYFIINQQMIGFDYKGCVKVWISNAFWRNLFYTRSRTLKKLTRNQSNVVRNNQFNSISHYENINRYNNYYKKYSISHQPEYDQKQMVTSIWMIVQKYSLFDHSIIILTNSFKNCTFQQGLDLIINYKNNIIKNNKIKGPIQFVNKLCFNDNIQKRDDQKYFQLRGRVLKQQQEKLVQFDLQRLFKDKEEPIYLQNREERIDKKRYQEYGQKQIQIKRNNNPAQNKNNLTGQINQNEDERNVNNKGIRIKTKKENPTSFSFSNLFTQDNKQTTSQTQKNNHYNNKLSKSGIRKGSLLQRQQSNNNLLHVNFIQSPFNQDQIKTIKNRTKIF